MFECIAAACCGNVWAHVLHKTETLAPTAVPRTGSGRIRHLLFSRRSEQQATTLTANCRPVCNTAGPLTCSEMERCYSRGVTVCAWKPSQNAGTSETKIRNVNDGVTVPHHRGHQRLYQPTSGRSFLALHAHGICGPGERVDRSFPK